MKDAEALKEALAQIGGEEGLAKLIENRKRSLVEAAAKLDGEASKYDVYTIPGDIDGLVSLLTLQERFAESEKRARFNEVREQLSAQNLLVAHAVMGDRRRWAWRFYASHAIGSAGRTPAQAASLADELLSFEEERFGGAEDKA